MDAGTLLVQILPAVAAELMNQLAWPLSRATWRSHHS
jgi:hypothetical protein